MLMLPHSRQRQRACRADFIDYAAMLTLDAPPRWLTCLRLMPRRSRFTLIDIDATRRYFSRVPLMLRRAQR